MANETLKTKYHILQDYLISIAEIPERVNRCDVVLKKELIEHINQRISSLVGTINGMLMTVVDYNYPKEYLPNKQFEYWAENTSSIFNYYELLRLRELIKNSIQITVKKEIYSNIFFDTGLDAFDFLNLHFTTKDNAPTTKFTILYHFLNFKKLIKGSAVEYLTFVKEYTNLNRTFSRLNFDSTIDKRYLKHEQELTALYKTFLLTQNF